MAKTNIEIGQRAIRIEAESIQALEQRINSDFDRAVKTILNCSGRVIVSGMGKAGLISQKIASTLASTGTPAIFIHPGDALHGDLGMVTRDDVIIALSNSGDTNEILEIVHHFINMGLPVVAFAGRRNSALGRLSDIVLDTSVEREAGSLNLVPTASTTAMLAMGDALAVALLEARKFKHSDFASLHPSGTLGKKLLLKVKHIMHTGDELPTITRATNVRDALFAISAKGLGVTGVVDDNGKMIGIITDGDIRRGFETGSEKIFEKPAEILMTSTPRWVDQEMLVSEALEVMETYSITSLFVHNSPGENIPIGLVHIHDILKSGIL